MTTLDQALAQMRAAGMPDFPPGHPRLNTDKIIRYGPKGKAWYRLWEYQARNGRSYIAGAFGLWGGPGQLGEQGGMKVERDFEGMDPLERSRLEQAQRDQEQAERAKRAARAKAAALRARAQWEGARSAPPSGVETYLIRKGLQPAKGLRWLPDGTMLVPMIRYDITEDREKADGYTGPWRLSGLQKIAPDGEKRFNKGMVKEGTACKLGPAVKRSGLFFIVEGVATGLSVLEATGGEYPVYVVFDAGNLMPAAKILRAIFPDSPVVFLADDDAYLVASFNKHLRDNFHVAELLQPPLTSAHVPGEVKTAKGWEAAGLVVSMDLHADDRKVVGLVGAVVHGERTYTVVRENTGRVKANAAAATIGNAVVLHPVFPGRPLPPDPDCDKLTDFNDLHKSAGIDAVREQLRPEIDRVKLSAEVRKVLAEERKAGKGKKSRKDRGGAGGDEGGGEPPGSPSFDFAGFFRRFTLIYPTDTLWDAQLQEIVKLRAVGIAFGERIVNHWLASDNRRMVNQDQLVFEPGREVDDGQINLFRGMPMKPDGSKSCELLLDLLQYLCGESDVREGGDTPVTDWVLKWLAYPLQHIGAKMRTAVVMHGEEGTGKNLIFGAIKDIYGEYGTLITQTELEDRFNGWLSRRLFLIANEVISRQEMRHHVGRLKNMVTEDVLPIREMFSPIRYESNHANMVFLTNEFKAMQISPGDRRYMIIRTPPPRPREYYEAVAAELRDGGAVALYHHLVNLDLGDFTEHAKPLLTAAKVDLIEVGLNSAQYFWHQLHDNMLWPLEYKPCLTMDLYRAYELFCRRTGEPRPRPMNQWVHEFSAMNGVIKLRRDIHDLEAPLQSVMAGGTKRRQGSVFVMGELPQDIARDSKEYEAWLLRSCREFKEDLRGFEALDRSKGEDKGHAKSQFDD